MGKNYYYKVFDIKGVSLITSISPAKVKSFPRFRGLINDGYGEMNINLDMKIDNIESYIDYMNLIKTYEVDDNNVNGRLIHQGHIEEIRPYRKSGDEGVEITLFPLNSRLDKSNYQTSNINPGVTFTNVDPSVIFKAVIDDFRLGNSSTYGNLLSYGNSTIHEIGTTISLSLTKLTHKQWIDKTFKKIGVSGYYHFVDVNGVFNFQPKPSTATHRFTLTKDVDEIIGRGSIKNMVNESTSAWGASSNGFGETYITAQGLSSINVFGKRKKYVTDNSIKDLGTANNLVVQKVAEGKDPSEGSELKINSIYDIESIKPGETCRVMNLSQGIRIFNSNMWINSIDYTRDRISLQLEDNNQIIEYQLKEWFTDSFNKQ